MVTKHLRNSLKQIGYLERGKIKLLLFISQIIQAKNVPLSLEKKLGLIQLNNRLKYEEKCDNYRRCRKRFPQL